MPLTDFQRQVLSAIASNRDPESYVGGGTVLQRSGIRDSNDIDIFHDREERLKTAVVLDDRSLVDAGGMLTEERRADDADHVLRHRGQR